MRENVEKINLVRIFAFKIFRYIFEIIVIFIDKIFLIKLVNIFMRSGFDLHDFAVIVKNICQWKGCTFAY